jgi:hypothetical protein
MFVPGSFLPQDIIVGRHNGKQAVHLKTDDSIIETPGGYTVSGLDRLSYDVLNLFGEN